MRRRVLTLAVIAVLVLLASSYIFVYAIWWQRIQRAKTLIEQLHRLEVGRTPEYQIRTLVAQYSGRHAAELEENGVQLPVRYDLRYDVALYAPYILIGGSARTLPGLRQWGLVASLEVKNGYLSNLYLSQGVLRADGFELHSTLRLNGEDSHAVPDGVPYYVYEAHITGPPGEAIGAELSAAASAEDRTKGFSFSFSCLTTLRGCRHVCDTFPSVWNDLTPRDRLTYGDGTPVNDYRECRKGVR
jgi:hypothetical protein